MNIEHPLLLLLAIPALAWVWWWHRRSATGMTRYKGIAAMALTACSALCLVAGLSGPGRLDLRKPPVDLTVLVDGSRSMDDRALSWARGVLADIGLAAPGDARVKVGMFAESVSWTGPQGLTRPDGNIDRTDIGRALSLALSSPAGSESRRMVLLTDGADTAGGAIAWAEAARRAGVRVDVIPPGTPVSPEFVLADLETPAKVVRGRPFAARAVLRGSREGDVRCELKAGSEPRQIPATVHLAPPETEVRWPAVDVPMGTSDRFEVKVECRPLELGMDSFEGNNSQTAMVDVAGKTRVWCLDEPGEQCRALSRVLGEAAEVSEKGVKAISRVPPREERPAAIVIGNGEKGVVAGLSAQLQAMTKAGVGLLFLGGRKALSMTDLAGSVVERDILPVRMAKKTQETHPAMAVLFVLDRSASMAGKYMGMAKAATISAARALPPDTLVGVIAFDENSRRYLDMSPVGNCAALERAVHSIQVGGGTNLKAAVALARSTMAPVKTGDRLVILVTDGTSDRTGLVEMARGMGGSGIRVSTIAIGSDADRVLLSGVAAASGGRAHYAASPDSVPSLMLAEMRRPDLDPIATGSREIQPSGGRTAARVFRGVDRSQLPRVQGYVLTEKRPEGEVLAASEKGEPIMALRRVGGASVAVFTPALTTEWASGLMDSAEGARLLGNLVQAVAGEVRQAEVRVEASVDEDRVRVDVDCLAPEGGAVEDAEVEAKAWWPDGTTEREFALAPLGLGRWSSEIPSRTVRDAALAVPTGTWRIEVSATIRGSPLPRVVRYASFPYPREMARFGTDVDMIARIAAAGGGKVGPTIPELFDTPVRTTVREPLAHWFLLPALALFLAGAWSRRW